MNLNITLKEDNLHHRQKNLSLTLESISIALSKTKLFVDVDLAMNLLSL